MILEFHSFGPIGTNSLLVGTEKNAYIFDAPQGCCEYWKERAQHHGLAVAGLFLTHSHWDHIVDTASIKKSFNIPVWVHSEDAGNVRQPGSDGLPLYFPIEGTEPDYLLQDGQELDLDGLAFTVIHTPGHTPGCVCFYSKERGWLIAGDTLFKGGIGRLDLPTSHPSLMKSSLEKLAALPPNTKVFPGHGDPTTIKGETAMISYLCQEEL